MKYLAIIISALAISLAQNVSADWVKFTELEDSSSVYIEMDTIKKVDGFIYYWVMRDFIVPDKNGDLSGQVYHLGECRTEKVKYLTFIFYTRNMGRGEANKHAPFETFWEYPAPGSSTLSELRHACSL